MKFNFYFDTGGANRISGIVEDMNFANLRNPCEAETAKAVLPLYYVNSPTINPVENKATKFTFREFHVNFTLTRNQSRISSDQRFWPRHFRVSGYTYFFPVSPPWFASIFVVPEARNRLDLLRFFNVLTVKKKNVISLSVCDWINISELSFGTNSWITSMQGFNPFLFTEICILRSDFYTYSPFDEIFRNWFFAKRTNINVEFIIWIQHWIQKLKESGK